MQRATAEGLIDVTGLETTITILGGLGLFLLGMSVMTDGLKALTGTAFREWLSRAARTPVRGAATGLVVTLACQSSSVSTMTTIGLVGAGLMTFAQAVGVVLGANIGSTGTTWLIALAGGGFSLSRVALPLVFLGAMLRLFGRGLWAGGGSAFAGLGLFLFGLNVLQDGMQGLAVRFSPTDLPGAGGGWFGLLAVAGLGFVMTLVVKSSSVGIAATISALGAGAISTEQAIALVVGQDLGSAVSSAIAAIGATTPAKRTAAAHVLFNICTAILAMALFSLYVPLLERLQSVVGAALVIPIYHTSANLLGVLAMLPFVVPFSRLIERLFREKGDVLTRHLDRGLLSLTPAAIEAARRTVAGAMHTLSGELAEALNADAPRARWPEASAAGVRSAMEQARRYLSDLPHPAESTEEQRRLAHVLHALDHADRLAENVAFEAPASPPRGDARGAAVRRDAGRLLAMAAQTARTVMSGDGDAAERARELAQAASSLAELRRAHRAATLDSASRGEISAAEAIERTDAVRWFDRLVYHASRCAAHLTRVAEMPANGAA